MAVYGAFISAPLGHVLISILQRMFSGRTSLRAKILQILVSNLVVSTLFSRHLPMIYLEAHTCLRYRSHPFRTPSI